MRETLLGMLVVVVLASTYVILKKHNRVMPQITLTNPETTHTSVSPEPVQPPRVAKNSRKLPLPKSIRTRIRTKGVHNEASHLRKHRPIERHGEVSRASVGLEPSEKLPSIYDEQEGRRADVEDLEGPETVLHGVPVKAYVRSQQSQVRIPKVPEKTDDSLRLIVGCMELKNKGAEYLDKECQSLLARKPVGQGEVY